MVYMYVPGALQEMLEPMLTLSVEKTSCALHKMLLVVFFNHRALFVAIALTQTAVEPCSAASV